MNQSSTAAPAPCGSAISFPSAVLNLPLPVDSVAEDLLRLDVGEAKELAVSGASNIAALQRSTDTSETA